MREDKLRFCRHPDDRGVDEILFVGGEGLPVKVEDAQRRAFLRVVVVERYKTSHLSGDEWRFSTVLQMREHQDWEDLSCVSDGMEDLYAQLYGDFQSRKPESAWLFRRRVASIAFMWKGNAVWSASYEGESVDLMVAAGHAPSARNQCSYEGQSGELFGLLKILCCQPGCQERLVSIYRKKKDHCRSCGTERRWKTTDVRGFCWKHLRRGDCALDDGDHNYDVIHGHGPGRGEPDPDKVSPSVYGGSIDMRPS